MTLPELRPSDATNLASIDTGREHLSHSRLSLFLACHRKYELHYLERLETISRPEPLSMGSAFQKAIEVGDPEAGPLVLDGYELRPKEALDEATTLPGPGWIPVGKGNATMHSYGCSHWAIPPVEPIHFHTQEAEDRHHVQQAVVRAAAALYLRTWPEPLGETREFEYVVRLRNPWTGHYSRTFDLKGYADGVIGGDYRETLIPRETGGGRIIGSIAPLELVENKLVGRVDNVTVQRLPLDRQIALARYGLWRATGRKVGKVHYRWVKKPSIKQRQKESLGEFLERIAADYEERPEFYAVQEQPKFVGSDDLLRIECELWTWAEQLRALKRARVFDRNTSHCSDYGGCDFIPICTGDPDAGALYRTRPERTEA